MTPAALLTFYLFLMFLLLIGLSFKTVKCRFCPSTKLCLICGERFIVKKKEVITRCPLCGSYGSDQNGKN